MDITVHLDDNRNESSFPKGVLGIIRKYDKDGGYSRKSPLLADHFITLKGFPLKDGQKLKDLIIPVDLSKGNKIYIDFTQWLNSAEYDFVLVSPYDFYVTDPNKAQYVDNQESTKLSSKYGPIEIKYEGEDNLQINFKVKFLLITVKNNAAAVYYCEFDPQLDVNPNRGTAGGGTEL